MNETFMVFNHDTKENERQNVIVDDRYTGRIYLNGRIAKIVREKDEEGTRTYLMYRGNKRDLRGYFGVLLPEDIAMKIEEAILKYKIRKAQG